MNFICMRILKEKKKSKSHVKYIDFWYKFIKKSKMCEVFIRK